MFLKMQLPWNVVIPAESLDTKDLCSKTASLSSFTGERS
ncbi:hypothetical protein CsSME_00020739 [Camellia sinensis var. sinensis]